MTDNPESPVVSSDLPARVKAYVEQRGLLPRLLEAPLVVGVSGGADSLALLYLLCELRGSRAAATLEVAHLNHALRGEESDLDARFVEETARSLGLPFSVERCDVAELAVRERLAVEQAARQARYGFFTRLASQRGAAVTVAHTADDQAETVLMNLLRGAGATGLGGMRVIGPVSPSVSRSETDTGSTVEVFRPLLGTWRHEIEQYCRSRNLNPHIDSSNTSVEFRRNKIRHELIPLLEREYNAGIKRHLVTAADVLALESDFLDAQAEALGSALARRSSDGQALYVNTEEAARLHEAMARSFARWCLRALSGTLREFTFEHITETAHLLTGKKSPPASLSLPHGLEVRAAGSQAVISRAVRGAPPGAAAELFPRYPQMDGEGSVRIAPGEQVELAGGWVVSCFLVEGRNNPEQPDEYAAHFDARALWSRSGSEQTFCLRPRRAGDVIRPLGMKGRKSLQDLYVDAKIPWDVRRLLPVVFGGEGREALWVPGPGGRRSDFAPVDTHTTTIVILKFIKPE